MDGQQEQNAVFVSNLCWWTTDVQLEQLCTQYSGGRVTGMKFIEDKSCGKSRGMCIVDLDSAQAVQRCIEGMHGVEVDGRPVRVVRQERRENRFQQGGGAMGRGGGPPGGMGGMGGMGGQFQPAPPGMMGSMPPRPRLG